MVVNVDFYKYHDKLLFALAHAGCDIDEVVMQPVYYIYKSDTFSCSMPHPLEYFLKDLDYRTQHEFRILIETTRKKFNKRFKQNNYCIKVDDCSANMFLFDYCFSDLIFKINEKELYFYLDDNEKFLLPTMNCD